MDYGIGRLVAASINLSIGVYNGLCVEYVIEDYNVACISLIIGKQTGVYKDCGLERLSGSGDKPIIGVS
jgi:hypothetical protein